jgi:hypothetical protein
VAQKREPTPGPAAFGSRDELAGNVRLPPSDIGTRRVPGGGHHPVQDLVRLVAPPAVALGPDAPAGSVAEDGPAGEPGRIAPVLFPHLVQCIVPVHLEDQRQPSVAELGQEELQPLDHVVVDRVRLLAVRVGVGCGLLQDRVVAGLAHVPGQDAGQVDRVVGVGQAGSTRPGWRPGTCTNS